MLLLDENYKDTGQIQVKAIGLISSFVLADKTFDPVCHWSCHSEANQTTASHLTVIPHSGN